METNQINVYDRPSLRLRRVAFTLTLDVDSVRVMRKRWLSRPGRDNKSLYYKIETEDGRIGWLGPMIRLP